MMTKYYMYRPYTVLVGKPEGKMSLWRLEVGCRRILKWILKK
jgi:hypothetical protein